MSTSDKIAIANMVSTIILSITTIVLSIFVYKATKKSADASEKTVNLTERTVELTEESFRLSKSVQEIQSMEAEKQKKALKMQYVDILYKKCKQILRAITSADATYIYNSLRDLEYQHGIKPETLAASFSDEEVFLIKNAWSALDTYMELYYKETYSGDEMGLLVTNAHIPYEPFEKLKSFLESVRIYY